MTEFYAELSSGIVSSLIITVGLMIITIILGLRVKKLSVADVPKGITLVSVMFVQGVNNMMHDFFKKNWKVFTPYMLTILLFLLFANTAALWGLSTPLSNISVALGFSILAFGSIQVAALVVKKPKQRAKDLMDPHPLFLPINLIGEMSTPFAMGIRLFGNLLSGAIIGIIVYGLSHSMGIALSELLGGDILGVLGYGFVQIFGVSAGAIMIHAIFDIFFGAIQAYVYFILFSIFLSMAVSE